MPARSEQDAFGQMMYDHLHGRGGFEVIERDDGFFNASAGPKLYFAPFDEWMQVEKDAMQRVRGRVLDIGCGAGRHALYLQERGLEVVGIDSSPLAVKTCLERGVKDARLLSLQRISRRLGRFDTVIMMGNNFGLVGGLQGAERTLQRLERITAPDGQIIAFTRDPYQTDDPDHRAYHERNRQRGRMGGQARIRVRYKKFVSAWFDLLMVSAQEMQDLLRGTAWEISEILKGEVGIYAAVLIKVK